VNLIYENPDDMPRVEGRVWPSTAHTMIGQKRLDNIQRCMEDVLDRDVPGDFIETGVWRGGATILMRAVLKARDVTDRRVWVADSFAGLPRPNRAKYPADAKSDLHKKSQLAIPLEQVQANFRRYGLLDDQVRFLKGFFAETLPHAPIERLAVVRLDGDMYESTMDAISSLYPRLSVGGYLIVDDYGCIPACRQAIHDYRDANGIADEIHPVDWTGVYWCRSA
jgi:O-methyltransferase